VNDEWREIRARSQEDAVEAAIAELGLSTADEVNVDVVEEPQKGLFGLGGKDGVFRVSKKKAKSTRRRSRGRGGRSSGSDTKRESTPSGKPGQSRDDKGGRSDSRSGGGSRQSSSRSRSGAQSKPQTSKSRSGGSKSKRRTEPKQAPRRGPEPRKEEAAEMPDLNEQATVIKEFLVGLLDAFGLEGSVETRIEDEDIIIANVTGEQAEALIGPKGSILQAILELTRTVVQRKTQAGARIRLDIGGYTERRRAALRIYAAGLAEQVLADGEEAMLEPMNPADRKVVHDAIAEVEGVRSYSEGEEPRRSVVVSPAPRD